MDILFKNVTLFDPKHPQHLQKLNLHIQNGSVKSFSTELPAADIVIEETDLWVSQGWFDMHAELTDPGFEYKEDIYSLSNAAVAGGFTEVLCFPVEEMPFQTKNVLQALQLQTEKLPVRFHVAAAATSDLDGRDLTEMLDLIEHGAVAFSDGDKPVQQADTVLKALEYLKISGGLFINKPEHLKLNERGQMHEGVVSTRLGLKGMPALAEELHLTRDLELLAFSGGRLHVPFVSTAASVQKIREAKANGLDVTCGIATYQLAFTDEEIIPFDTNYKVNPPFRSKTDRAALIGGLLDGTIDVLVSGHKPQDIENKRLEFDHAAFGVINLETAFAAVRTFCPELPLETVLEKMVVNPRKILNLSLQEISTSESTNLTFFQPEKTWIYEEENVRSKSKNSPFLGRELKGYVFGVINKGQFVINEAAE